MMHELHNNNMQIFISILCKKDTWQEITSLFSQNYNIIYQGKESKNI